MSRKWEWCSVSPVVKWNPSVSQIIKPVVWILLNVMNIYKLYLDCYQWENVKSMSVAYWNKSLTLQSCMNTAGYICTERERWVWVHQVPFPIQQDAVNSRTLNFKIKCAKKQKIQNIKARKRPCCIIHVYRSWKKLKSHLWFILWKNATSSFNTESSRLKSKAKGRSADLSCANANIRLRNIVVDTRLNHITI